MNFTFNAPLNRVSFGQVSLALLREIFSRKDVESFRLFPISGIDLQAFLIDEEFKANLEKSINGAQISHSRNTPTVKLWHIQDLLNSLSDKRIAITFHETSELTKSEINILNQLDFVIVTSSYTKQVFENHGLKNVVLMPLGFDTTHFKQGQSHKLDAIVFNLSGKLEDRKNTLRILKSWNKLFGGNKNYRLNCTIFNSFISQEDQSRMVMSALGGKVPWNMNFLPHQATNLDYNKVLNACDIDLTGMSSCEGFNLPAFQALCLGKWGVFLNAHVHKDYVNASNSILVEPSGMREAKDNIFFKQDGLFNCGQWHDFKDEDLESAMIESVKYARTFNKSGEALKDKFTYQKSCDILLQTVAKLV